MELSERNRLVIARIEKFNPRLICFVVYGQNVNAGTTNMRGAVDIANFLKIKKVPKLIAFGVKGSWYLFMSI